MTAHPSLDQYEKLAEDFVNAYSTGDSQALRRAADGFVMLGGPLGDDANILLVVDAPRESAIRSTLAQDPWSQSGILEIHAIQRWTILLVKRRENFAFPSAKNSITRDIIKFAEKIQR